MLRCLSLHLRVPAGEHPYGDVASPGIAAQSRQNLVAIFMRHAKVHQDQIGPFLPSDRKPLCPIRRADDCNSVPRQTNLPDFPYFWVVVNAQNCGC